MECDTLGQQNVIEAEEPLDACAWTYLGKDQNPLVTLTNVQKQL